eukprot:TRINITY_DN7762_c0_g1_i1.p1 TRINITY_DN7762_c0_g1~~TRINITY_DN7762_c0_g1_i1.p1  ORF type:complete len:126 (+),score=15.98 TRINITY_DN7762_c0_g1_i1:323-700(+)
MSRDPWESTQYISDESGNAAGNVMIQGFTMDQVNDRAIVVHANDGDKIGCGTINLPQPRSAEIFAYPESSSNVRGFVDVSPTTSGILLKYTFTGLQASVTGGWHVHVGKTCADKSLWGAIIHSLL